MGVMLQGFYRRGTAGVPSPADGDHTLPWWWDHLASQARALREVGYTAVWLPPPLKGSSGTFSVGYDVFDDYDLGAKQQMGTVPTRYGTREQLARCVATLRACGLDAYVDLVPNQRAGGVNFRYRYKGADGGEGGRFPKDPLQFHPNVPQDPGVFGGPREASFGDDLAIVNARPPGYVSTNLIAAVAWLTRALDVQGYRIDDAKGVSSQFVPRLLEAEPMAGKFAVAEFFDGDVGYVEQWLSAVGRRSAVFDFSLRFTLAAMCNGPDGFDMRSLERAGLAGVDPMHSVTFVEDQDTDASPALSPIVTNKMLAYAYVLTSEGYPCVYYKDYSTDRGCYGLKPFIDNLVWIHEKLAAGPTVQRWKDPGLFCFERLGGPHLLVGINKDGWQSRVVTVDTGFGANVHLHDYSGHAPDVWTNGEGQATITVPRNVGGLAYACYSVNGVGFGFPIQERAVTQELEGAADLDIGPVGMERPTVLGRIWVEQGKRISATLRELDHAGFSPTSRVDLVVEDPEGAQLVTGAFSRPGGPPVQAVARKRGWHRLTLQARDTPPLRPERSFTLAVTYTAPQGGP